MRYLETISSRFLPLVYFVTTSVKYLFLFWRFCILKIPEIFPWRFNGNLIAFATFWISVLTCLLNCFVWGLFFLVKIDRRSIFFFFREKCLTKVVTKATVMFLCWLRAHLSLKNNLSLLNIYLQVGKTCLLLLFVFSW